MTMGQCDQQGFNFVYGTDDHEEVHSVTGLTNGDVVVLATTDGLGEGQRDWLVTRFDPLGNMVWSKVVGTHWNEDGSYSGCTSDATGIYITGYSQQTTNSERNWVFFKLSFDGDLLWSKKMDSAGSQGDTPRAITTASNGDLLMVGTTNNFGEGSSDGVMMRIDNEGNVLWCKTLGTPNAARNDHLLSVVELPNGNFIAAGNSESWYNSNTDQPWLVEFGPTGTVVGEHVLTSSSLGMASHIIRDDSHIFVCGWTETLSSSRDVFVCKLTFDYDLIWQRNLVADNDLASANIQLNSTGEIVATQQGDWLDNGSHDIISFGLSTAGDLLWSSLVDSDAGSAPGSYPFNMIVGSDDHQYVANHTTGFDLTSSQIQFVKLDACGQNGCEQDIVLSLDNTEFAVNVESNGEHSITTFSEWECAVSDVTLNLVTDELCEPCALDVDISGRTLCAGEIWNPDVEISGADENEVNWQWTASDGQEFDGLNPAFVFDETGTYEITVTAWIDGCEDTATTAVYVYPGVQVSINQDGNILTASQGIAYQWYLNGLPIDGATNMGYEMLEDGVYSVEVTDVHGCSGEASIDALMTGLSEVQVQFPISVFPNPTSDFVQVICLNPNDLDVFLYDPQGKLVQSAVLRDDVLTIDVKRLPQGAYFMSFWNAEGCIARRTILIQR
jgi:hypothetical protein